MIVDFKSDFFLVLNVFEEY